MVGIVALFLPLAVWRYRRMSWLRRLGHGHDDHDPGPVCDPQKSPWLWLASAGRSPRARHRHDPRAGL